jgi:hypothetical protein
MAVAEGPYECSKSPQPLQPARVRDWCTARDVELRRL